MIEIDNVIDLDIFLSCLLLDSFRSDAYVFANDAQYLLCKYFRNLTLTCQIKLMHKLDNLMKYNQARDNSDWKEVQDFMKGICEPETKTEPDI